MNYRFIYIALIFVCLLFSSSVSGEDTLVYFYEDFEEGIGDDWSQNYIKGNIDWYTLNGGYSTDTSVQGGGNPPYAYEGDLNALFHYTSLNQETTRLITPPIALDFAIRPELHFMHAQEKLQILGEQSDKLRVLIKTSSEGDWHVLDEYNDPTTGWVFRKMLIPDSLLSQTNFIAFEAKTRNGWGVCIDTLEIVEKGIRERFVDTVIAYQASTDEVPTGTDNNPILRIEIKVNGTFGTIKLNSATINTLNTKAGNIKPQGVKLYATDKSTFSIKNPIGTPQDMQQYVTFNNLNHTLKTGYNYIYVTYDVRDDATQSDTLDAMLDYHSLDINTLIYPAVNHNPKGRRIIFETMFLDDFETDLGWTLTGEFERDTARGLGGSVGSPDPEQAYSGTYVLGTDLSGLGINEGDYENSLSAYEYTAISPVIDCGDYKDIHLRFRRWLNVDLSDDARIDVSTDNSDNWKKVWINNGVITDDEWKKVDLDISHIADRASDIRVRFSLGPSDAAWVFSGWNIDNLFITGDFVYKDIALREIISPSSGTDLTSAEQVKIKIENIGVGDITEDFDIQYILKDQEGNEYTSTGHVTTDIHSDDSLVYTFAQTVDLSEPGYYELTIINHLSTDEYTLNDTLFENVYVIPTRDVPYVDYFEDPNNFWFINGFEESIKDEEQRSSWEWGKPDAFLIDHAASDSNAWVTDLDGYYLHNDTSFIETPYFDFTGVNNPYFEMKVWVSTDKNYDGAKLLYSIDQGNTWNTVYENASNPYGWEWYGDGIVTALGTKGWWDSIGTAGWRTVQQFLPDEIKDSKCKFRILFASGPEFSFHEGFAFDDVIISDAPPDLSVAEVLFPDDTCELGREQAVSIKIKNEGIHVLPSGETLRAGIFLQDSLYAVDTFETNSSVPVNGTYNYTFNRTFNMYDSGAYHLKTFVWHERDHNVYGSDNDTLEHTVNVVKPDVELGPNIYTFRPDTVTLFASTNADYNFKWSDGSIAYYLDLDTAGTYSVTVTDPVGGCTARDTVEVVKLLADIELNEIMSPESACMLENDESVTVKITNTGIDKFHSGNPFEISYKLNDDPAVQEAFASDDTLRPGDTLIYTFSGKADFSEVKEHRLKAFIHYVADNHPENDTVQKEINVAGPDFDLFPDDTNHWGFTYNLNAGYQNPGGISFEWEDGSTDSIFEVTSRNPQYYTVTASEPGGCQVVDSARVKLVIPDIALVKMLTPSSSSCGPVSNDNVVLAIANTGTYMIDKGTPIPLNYKIDNGSVVTDHLEPATDFYPGDTLYFGFGEFVNLTDYKPYEITSYVSWERDSLLSNDTIAKTIYIYEEAKANIPFDDITIYESTFDVYPGAFKTYKWHDGSDNSTFEVNASNANPTTNVYVTVTNVDGCKDTDHAQVTLYFSDVELTEIEVPDTICGISNTQPFKVKMTNKGTDILSSNIIQLTYLYGDEKKEDVFLVSDLDDVTSVYYNESFSYTSSSVYAEQSGFLDFTVIAHMTDDRVAENDTLTKTIYMKGLPSIQWQVDGVLVDAENEATYKAELPAELSVYGASSNDYVWNTGSSSQKINVASEGGYAVTVTDYKNCSAGKTIFIKESTGIHDMKNAGFTMNVYPNPTSEYIHYEISSEQESGYVFKIYQSNGTLMYHKEIDQEVNTEGSIPVSHFNKGIYYLHVIGDDYTEVRKIIIW